jgi:signal-induced proliferation-associated 1 like protein 1
MLQFGGGKKKDLTKPGFVPDGRLLRGALSWSIWVEETSPTTANLATRLDGYLAISSDSLVIIEGNSREPLFAIPTAAVLGWNSSMSGRLRIYYHEGECISLGGKGGESDEELLEVVARLESVTKGAEVLEFVLRRQEGTQQLGFHVQHDGVITEVEPSGCAAKAGIKQGSRLVEICKVVVATLSQDEMIEMLKTSAAVVLLVVPPFGDNSPRRGCVGRDCCSPETKFVKERELGGGTDLYENIHLNGRGEGGESSPPSHPHTTHFKQNPHRRK